MKEKGLGAWAGLAAYWQDHAWPVWVLNIVVWTAAALRLGGVL